MNVISYHPCCIEVTPCKYRAPKILQNFSLRRFSDGLSIMSQSPEMYDIFQVRRIPVTKASNAVFGVFFDLPLNKRLSKHS